MRKLISQALQRFYIAGITGLFLTSCNQNKPQAVETKAEAPSEFDFVADRFADIQVLRYQVKGFDQLTLQQKQLAYYLYQAGLSGRDIFYDQKNKNNLRVRKTIECVLETYKGDKNAEDYKKFETYAKRGYEFSFCAFAKFTLSSNAPSTSLSGNKAG